MLFERLGGADRGADVAEAGDAADDRARSDAVRRHEALENAPVLEAQDVEPLRSRVAPDRARSELHRARILQLSAQPFDDRRRRRARALGGEAEHFR